MTNNQARDIYIKVESESIVNVETIKQEIETDTLDYFNNLDDNEVNPYHEIIINKVERENIITSQMERWPILSNVVYYVKYDRHPKNFYNLDINTIDQKSHNKIYDKCKEEEGHILDLDFGDIPEKIKRRLFRHV